MQFCRNPEQSGCIFLKLLTVVYTTIFSHYCTGWNIYQIPFTSFNFSRHYVHLQCGYNCTRTWQKSQVQIYALNQSVFDGLTRFSTRFVLLFHFAGTNPKKLRDTPRRLWRHRAFWSVLPAAFCSFRGYISLSSDSHDNPRRNR